MLKCKNVTNVKMWKCENVTSDYKRLRILEKFLRSYVYEWRGTPMLCPKSPHRLRLRCQYLSAVAVNICRLSLSKFDTAIIMPLPSSSHGSQCNYCNYCNHHKQNDMRYAICDMRYAIWQSQQSMRSMQSCRSYWMLTFKNLKVFHMLCVFHVEQIKVFHAIALRVPRGTSAMQLLRVQVGVQT